MKAAWPPANQPGVPYDGVAKNLLGLTMIRLMLTATAILTVFVVTVWHQHGDRRHDAMPAIVEVR